MARSPNTKNWSDFPRCMECGVAQHGKAADDPWCSEACGRKATDPSERDYEPDAEQAFFASHPEL